LTLSASHFKKKQTGSEKKNRANSPTTDKLKSADKLKSKNWVLSPFELKNGSKA
jgi:hypothetical protein